MKKKKKPSNKNKSSKPSLSNSVYTEQKKFLIKEMREYDFLIFLSLPLAFMGMNVKVSLNFTLLLIGILCAFIFLRKTWNTLMGSFTFMLLITNTLRYMWALTSEKLNAGNFVVVHVIYFLWLAIILLFALVLLRNDYEVNPIVKTLPKFMKMMHTPAPIAIKLMQRVAKIYPIIMYLVITISTIGLYGNIYYIEQPFGTWDQAVYFSAVTYFTVGYGDVSPLNANVKMAAMLEMLNSSMVNIVFIPLLISIFMTFISKSNQNNSKIE